MSGADLYFRLTSANIPTEQAARSAPHFATRWVRRLASGTLIWALALTPAPGGFGQESPPNPATSLDRRVEMLTARSATVEQLEAVSELRQELGGSLLESYDPSSGVTRSLFNPVGTISPPQSGSAVDIAADYVGERLTLLGLAPSDIDGLELCDSVYSSVTGATHVYFCQTHQGLPVIDAQLQVNVSRDGAILSVNNGFVPNIDGNTQSVQTDSAVPAIGDLDACSAVASHLGIPLTQVAGQPGGTINASDLSTEPIDAALAWLPIGAQVKLVWRFTIHTLDGKHVYDFTVDATEGHEPHDAERVLTRFDYVSPGLYQVYPTPIESPSHASPATPEDGRQFVDTPEDPVASPLGWHDDGTTAYTIMRGNNVHAYADRVGADLPPAIEPDCGPGLNCTFPLDLTQSPDAYTSASVANLFYWTNLVHDVQYLYGFDEAAGNFQVDNFGLGGLGGDDVRAEAQDGSGFNNANFTTFPDGLRPRIQMFLWSFTTPGRDGDLDNGIIVHEYGHGISTRLVGGPSTVSCLSNPQQPGEGLSDWWALAYTAKASDLGADRRSLGTYVFGEPTDGFGIRTQQYSTDPTINTHSYESIRNMAIPHGVGEVWAQAAWEVYWALVNAHGFSPDLHDAMGTAGNQRMMLYVNEGLKNTACSPTFTDVRDGILQAAIDNHQGQDVCRMWDAFAAFGLGIDADSAGPLSLSVTNGFQVPAACLVGPRITVPIQGAKLDSDTVTFEWIPDGEDVTDWRLDVGSIPGQADIYESVPLPATTLALTVPNLPLDGRQLFVKLHYRINGVWDFRNFTYTAKIVEPRIVSPEPGSTLDSHSVLFSWIPEGVSVDGWILSVGTNPGQGNFFYSGSIAGTDLSVQAVGLPTDSSLLNVRLLYLIGEDWHALDYSYTAADLVPDLTSPIPQSVLVGPDVTFSWASNGAAVSTWVFQMGSNPGQTNYFYSGPLEATETSITVSGLPTDARTLHARLRYQASGRWDSIDYIFTAADLTPELAGPAPGSVLTNSTQLFEWSDNGASISQWVFQIGSSPGQTNVFYSGSLAGNIKSVTATGLPTDSRTLYARLRFLASGTWGHEDYVFTAADLVPAMTSPTPASILTASDVFFDWSDNGAAVTSWTFRIGSNPGQSNFFYSGSLPSTETSVNVTGLPTDSRTLHARLGFQSSGVWKHIDYVYTAAELVPALGSPLPGSTLQSSNALFSWSSNGAAVERWIFQIGTSPGLTNLYYSGSLTPDIISANVSDLPVDSSTLHVRLRYLLSTGWSETDYTFTAASPGPSMVAPAPGSQLSGGTVTFNWSANGFNVSEWRLFIGDTVGTSIYNSGPLGSQTLSELVSDLPKDGRPLFVRLEYTIGGEVMSRDYNYTAALAEPKLTSPLPGSYLDEIALFEWTNDGIDVEGWSLFVGNTEGAWDLYDSGPLAPTVTSKSVENLPDDGRPLFVRLNFTVDGIADFRDYTFFAFLDRARLTAPVPNTSFVGSDVQFTWTPGAQNVTSWIFLVGTSPGLGNFHNSGIVGANILNASVTGLPTDARTIHVRLRYLSDGLWSSTDYVYTAANLVPELLSPTPQTTLASGDALFSWTSNGATVTNWIFQVGTTLGSSNLHYSGLLPQGSASANVENLPTDATTLYVRLRYLSAGAWKSTDYTYTAADLRPELVSPTPGSTLDGSNILFSWISNGSSVTNWIFQIGTSVGSNNLFYSGALGANASSAQVNGLPTDSRTLFVRLRYLTRNTWKTIDYEYTAAQLTPAMVAPLPENPVYGTVDFTWTSNGAPVTQWIFQLGTVSGTSNLYYSGALGSNILTVNVEDLPVASDGSPTVIYGRLRYLVNGAWKALDITYNAAGVP